MSILADLLMATPLDLASVGEEIRRLGMLQETDELREELRAARRAVRFDGNLRHWDFAQATFKMIAAMADLRPELRRATAARMDLVHGWKGG